MPVSKEARTSLHDETPLQVMIDTGTIIERAIEKRLLPLRISFIQQRLLAILHFAPAPLNVGTLAVLLLQEAHSISGLLNRLEDDHGFLTRSRTRDDRRVVLVTLTPKGRRIAQESLTVLRSVLEELEGTLRNDQPDGVGTLAREVLDEGMKLSGFEQGPRAAALKAAGIG